MSKADKAKINKIDMIEKKFPRKKETVKYLLNVRRNEDI